MGMHRYIYIYFCNRYTNYIQLNGKNEEKLSRNNLAKFRQHFVQIFD